MPVRGLAAPPSWMSKGLLAALDQGTYSITMFVTSVVLARSLSPAEYGAYALVFAALLLIGTFQDSLVTEPLLVYGASKYRQAFGPYFEMLAGWQIITTVGFSLCLAAVVAAMPGRFPHPWSENILGLAVAMPPILLAWLVRRAFYARTAPGEALVNSLAQAACIIAGLYFVVTAGRMTALVAFLILGGGAAVSASLGWYRIRKAGRGSRAVFQPREPVLDHWRYGRWLLLSNVPAWFVLNGYTVLAGALLALNDVAGLRAIQTLVAPIPVMLNAFGTLTLPWLVRQRADAGPRTLMTSVARLSWVFVGLALLAAGPLLVWGGTFTSLLYGGRYAEYLWLLPYLAGAQLLASGCIGLGLGLRTFEASRRLLIASLIAATSVAAVGYVAIRLAGLHGLAFSTIITQAVAGWAFFTQLRRESRGRAATNLHPVVGWAPVDRLG